MLFSLPLIHINLCSQDLSDMQIRSFHRLLKTPSYLPFPSQWSPGHWLTLKLFLMWLMYISPASTPGTFSLKLSSWTCPLLPLRLLINFHSDSWPWHSLSLYFLHHPFSSWFQLIINVLAPSGSFPWVRYLFYVHLYCRQYWNCFSSCLLVLYILVFLLLLLFNLTRGYFFSIDF